MGVVLFLIIVVIVIVWAAIYDNKPEQKKKREDAFARSIGYDPDSSEYALLKLQAQLNQMDANLQKKEQKKETAQIIKGAVVGGVVAGDVGAVVGAVAAKNKVENERGTKPKSNEQELIDLYKSNLETLSAVMKETPKATPSHKQFGFSDPEKERIAEDMLLYMEEGTRYTVAEIIELLPYELDEPRAVGVLYKLRKIGIVENIKEKGRSYYLHKRSDEEGKTAEGNVDIKEDVQIKTKSELEKASTSMNERHTATLSCKQFGFPSPKYERIAEDMLLYMKEGTRYTAVEIVELLPCEVTAPVVTAIMRTLRQFGKVEITKENGKSYYMIKKEDDTENNK